MPVTDSFRDFVVEQLELSARDIRVKRMFGAVGIYSGDLFFAVIDDDRLYFKVDSQTRPQYEAEGMQPARIDTEAGQVVLSYYEVPLGALEAPDELRVWVKDAIAVAARAAAAKSRVKAPKPGSPRKSPNRNRK
jgi:DNA transformation protein and related proteins